MNKRYGRTIGAVCATLLGVVGVGQGCGGEDIDEQSENLSQSSACEAAGGECEALINPGACTGGQWGDAQAYSCGGNLGVGCCFTPEAPAPAANDCEAAGGECEALINPGACTDGEWGDAEAYSCGPNLGQGCCFTPEAPLPAESDCEAAGGECVGAINPGACTDGEWGDGEAYSCGGNLGVGCCFTPEAPAPAE